MSREVISEMLERFQTIFEKTAVEETAEWYDDVAQGLAFATNSIPASETEGES